MMTLSLQDNFFTEKDYESYTSQPKLSDYLQSFIGSTSSIKNPLAVKDGQNVCLQLSATHSNTHDKDLHVETSDNESVILAQINKSVQSDGVNIQYPRLSYLSVEEQRIFLDGYEKAFKGLDLDRGLSKSAIKEIKAKIVAEQQEFQHFVYQHVRNNLEVFNVVPEDVKDMIKASPLSPKQARIKMYPQYYNLHQTIGLSVGAHFRNDPLLEFQEFLLQVGDVPMIAEPKVKVKLSLKDCSNNVAEANVPLSQDPTAVRLAKEHGAHIVISSSCLQTLFDNQPPQYNQQWDIPMVVMDTQQCEAVKTDGQQTGRIVFLDKPFPKKVYTPQQVMRKAYKRALMKTLCANDEKNKRNFVYSLWKFGKFRILLRCKLDAYKTDDKTQCRTFLSVATKPEYHSYFGHERLATSETAKWWLKSFIRPNTIVLCARVNASTHEVLRVDELTPPDVLACGSVFNPGQSMKMVYRILCNLTQLSDSSYLLSHQPDSIHCCLYKQSKQSLSTKKPEVDLYDRYTKPATIINCCTSDIPWAGIDTELFLSAHIDQKRIPATFPAISDSILQRILQKRAEDYSTFSTDNYAGRKKKMNKKAKKKNLPDKKPQGNFNRGKSNSRSNQGEYHTTLPAVNQERNFPLPNRQRRPLTYRDLDATGDDE